MKKIFAFGFAALVMLSLTLTSCTKYDEGKGISLRSRQARLCQTWKPTKYVDASGVEVAAGANDGTLTLDKDGTVSSVNGSTTITGTWAWANDKDGITFSYTILGTTITETVSIVILTMKEFGIKDSDGDKTYYEAQ